MLPTLNGRIQTRIFLLVVVGGIWTLLLTPLLGQPYSATYTVLIAVLVLGIGWELVYHFIQQFRWEKDWPTFFGLVTAINEGILLYALLAAGAVPGRDGARTQRTADVIADPRGRTHHSSTTGSRGRRSSRAAQEGRRETALAASTP